MGERAIGVWPSGGEKGEQRQPVVSLPEINFCHQRNGLVPGGFHQHPPEGIDDAARAVKVEESLRAKAVGQGNKESVGRRVTGHNPPQQWCGVEIRVVGFGADGGGVTEHVSAGECIATRHFREPLIPAGRVAHLEVHAVQFKTVHWVGVIGWPLRKVVILEIALGHWNVEFAGTPYAFTVRRNNDGAVETALVGCPGALKEGDLHVHVTFPGEFTRQRKTWPAL